MQIDVIDKQRQRSKKYADLSPYMSSVNRIRNCRSSSKNVKQVNIQKMAWLASFRIKEMNVIKNKVYEKIYCSKKIPKPHSSTSIIYLNKQIKSERQKIQHNRTISQPQVIPKTPISLIFKNNQHQKTLKVNKDRSLYHSPNSTINYRHIQKSSTARLNKNNNTIHSQSKSITNRTKAIQSQPTSLIPGQKVNKTNNFRKNKFFSSKEDTKHIQPRLNNLTKYQNDDDLDITQKLHRKLRSKEIELSIQKSTQKYLQRQHYHHRPLKSNNDIEIYVSTVRNPSKNKQSHESTINSKDKTQKQQLHRSTNIQQNGRLSYQFDFKEQQVQKIIEQEYSSDEEIDSSLLKEIQQQLRKQLHNEF